MNQARLAIYPRLLFETRAGSHLYGIATETSDEDYRAVYAETASQLVGIGGEGKVLRSPEGAAVDWEAQPLRQFARLAMACNPNILDTLFAPREHWLVSSPDWQALYQIRHAFLNTRAKRTFLAMARNHLERVRAPNNRTGKSSRMALIERYGHDVKDAGHLVRLLLKAEMLIKDGDYNPVLTGLDRQMVVEVRAGQTTLPEVLAWADDRHAELDALPVNLPDEPNRALVERTVIDIHRTWLRQDIPALA